MKKKSYVLKHGKFNTKNSDGTPHIARKGDTIELSDGQAKAYADMIVPVALHKVEERIAKDQAAVDEKVRLETEAAASAEAEAE